MSVQVVTDQHPNSGLSGRFTLPKSFLIDLNVKARNEDLKISQLLSDSIFSKDHFIIATINGPDAGYRLHCFSIEDKALLWSREMIKYCGEGKYSGQTSWSTKVSIAEDTVYLFHCSEMVHGSEGISLGGNASFYFPPAVSPPTVKTDTKCYESNCGRIFG